MKVGMNKCSEANSSSTALLDSLPILTLALQFRATPAGRRSSSSRTEKEDILSGVYVKSSHLNLYSTYPIALHCVRTVPGLRVHSYTTARPVYHIAQCTTRRHMFRLNLRQRRIFTKVPLAHIVGFLTRLCVNSCFPPFQPGHLSDPTLLPRRLYSASPAS